MFPFGQSWLAPRDKWTPAPATPVAACEIASKGIISLCAMFLKLVWETGSVYRMDVTRAGLSQAGHCDIVK
jgi:hypothetical protein